MSPGRTTLPPVASALVVVLALVGFVLPRSGGAPEDASTPTAPGPTAPRTGDVIVTGITRIDERWGSRAAQMVRTERKHEEALEDWWRRHELAWLARPRSLGEVDATSPPWLGGAEERAEEARSTSWCTPDGEWVRVTLRHADDARRRAAVRLLQDELPPAE